MSAKVVLSLNGNVTAEYALNKETILIGRKPDCDISVDNLAVSGRHAQIITILNDSFLEDLNSTNGTYVNGSLIKKHALKQGDVIGIGKHQLKYINQNASTADFEKTMIIRPDAAGMPELTSSQDINESVNKIASQEASKGAAPASVGMAAKLQILNGTNAGKELELVKALTTIGKPGTQVAAVTRRPQGYFIIHVDGGPVNATPIINGKKIGTQATALHNHDVIEVAGVKMEFFLS